MSHSCKIWDYCKKIHSNKECPLEEKLAPFMKKLVGMYMEQFVANEIYCPRCKCKSLEALSNHTPSLDIICKNCNSKFEIKSKCMSAKIIPNDLYFNHGNYDKYVNQQEEGLDILLIIYSVCRKTKIITIRNVFYVFNEYINCLQVVRKPNSSLSQIIVPDYKNLPEIILDEIYAYDFSDNIKTIINTIRPLEF